MKKQNKNFPLNLIFCIEIFSLFIFIKSIPFYILEQAKQVENLSQKSNVLSFTIKAGINEAFNQDKSFQIQSEIYNDVELLKKTNIDCSIPKSPDADFGTKIDINCEIDLLTISDGNKVKFLEFISNSDDDLNIIDRNNNILGNYLSFTIKTNNKQDYEFTTESINSIKCFENKFVFGLKGEIDKYWIKGFSFNITWNDNFPLSAKCVCPNVYFSSEIMINCTLELINDDTFINNLNKGIIIKENIYEAIDSNNEKKIIKINIKDNKEKIELNEIECEKNVNEKKEKKNDYNFELNDNSDRVSQNDNSKEDSGGVIYNTFKNTFFPGKKHERLNKNKIEKEEEDQKKWEREKEEEKKRKKEEEEDEKNRKEQEDLQRYIRQRQREEEEDKRRKEREEEDERKKKKEEEEREKEEQRRRKQNYYNSNDNYYNQNQNNFRRKRNYEDNDNNSPNNYNRQRNGNKYNENDDFIDDNSGVKLLHLQVRYSYGFLYYMGYALTPIPLGHKIKLRFSVSRLNYENGFVEQENENIILKSEEEITPNDKNIIVEYVTRYDCEKCKKIILDKNYIKGAEIYNLPKEQRLLDAIEINKNNYLTKGRMQNPPLYITENIYTQNCLINLGGNFFNKNRFFASKFELNLINVGYYNNNKNLTVYCSLNERGIFSCPITENLNNFEYKLEQFIIDTKENIIIDNSILSRQTMTNRASCQIGSRNNFQNNINNNMVNNYDKNNNIVNVTKTTRTKKIIIWILTIVIVYFIVNKYCCKKEEEYSDEYNSRWRVSSSNYGGETYGLRGRGW